MPRVLICGDRNWKDTGAIRRCIEALPPESIVVEGEARGADKIAGSLANEAGLEVLRFPADWNQYGKAAGPIRNRQMLQEGNPDLVIYFHNNLHESKGTKDMVRISQAKDVPVINGRSVTNWAPAIAWYLNHE